MQTRGPGEEKDVEMGGTRAPGAMHFGAVRAQVWPVYSITIQGYLTHTRHPPARTLQKDYNFCHMMVL